MKVLSYEFREEHYSFSPSILRVIAVMEDKSTRPAGELRAYPYQDESFAKIIHSANEWIRAKEAPDA